MYSPCNRPAHTVRIAALILGAVLTHRAGAAAGVERLRRSSQSHLRRWMLRVARAVAKTQGYSVKLVPFVGYGKGGDGLPPGRFAKMAQSECQLIMGFPVDVSHPNLPPNVEATSAYASTGFVLIRRGSSAKMSLSELPNGSEVGIAQLDTYAGLLFSTHPNIVMHVYPKDSLMLADLDGEAHRGRSGLAAVHRILRQQAPRASHRSAWSSCPASTCSGTWSRFMCPQSQECCQSLRQGSL